MNIVNIFKKKGLFALRYFSFQSLQLQAEKLMEEKNKDFHKFAKRNLDKLFGEMKSINKLSIEERLARSKLMLYLELGINDNDFNYISKEVIFLINSPMVNIKSKIEIINLYTQLSDFSIKGHETITNFIIQNFNILSGEDQIYLVLFFVYICFSMSSSKILNFNFDENKNIYEKYHQQLQELLYKIINQNDLMELMELMKLNNISLSKSLQISLLYYNSIETKLQAENEKYLKSIKVLDKIINEGKSIIARSLPQNTLKSLLDMLKIDYEFEKKINPYIADFYFPHLNLVLEYDGQSHFYGKTMKRKTKGILKEHILKSLSYKVKRIDYITFSNKSLTQKLELIKQIINVK